MSASSKTTGEDIGPMTNSPLTPGIVPGRLPAAAYARNFGDHTPALDGHEARVAADRCYFCHDAPCIKACPTDAILGANKRMHTVIEAYCQQIFHHGIYHADPHPGNILVDPDTGRIIFLDFVLTTNY